MESSDERGRRNEIIITQRRKARKGGFAQRRKARKEGFAQSRRDAKYFEYSQIVMCEFNFAINECTRLAKIQMAAYSTL